MGFKEVKNMIDVGNITVKEIIKECKLNEHCSDCKFGVNLFHEYADCGIRLMISDDLIGLADPCKWDSELTK
jgi:hypothetical protein